MLELIIFTIMCIFSYILIGVNVTKSGLSFFSHRVKSLDTLTLEEENNQEIMEEKYIEYITKNGITYSFWNELMYSLSVTLFLPIWIAYTVKYGYDVI